LFIDHDDLAARDRRPVDEQVDGLAGHPVQRDDRAVTQLERLADRHLRASHLNCHLDGHIAQPPQVSARAEVRGSLSRAIAQLFEFDFLGHWQAPYWTATSVNRTSLTFTSVEFRIVVRILCFSLSRWFESMSAVLFWLVRMFTMRSR